MNKFLLVIVLIAIWFSGCKRLSFLEAGFTNPPDSARPGVYWYFMDGNLSVDGITKDLESMKAAGIGYVLFMEVNVGVPRGDVDYMSEEWQDRFVHAVRECERLGIVMAVGIGPGWNGSGGPWVEGRQSMQHLVYSKTEIEGGKGLQSINLPKPGPKKPFFGRSAFTPESRERWENYYEDVTVLAVPAGATVIDTIPVSGSSYMDIPEIDERALYYRKPYSSSKGVPQFIPMSGYMTAQPGDIAINKSEIKDVTALFNKETGKLEWDAPRGKWNIMRFGATNNGAATRPAPIPGVGFESDKLDSSAIRFHLDNFTEKLFSRAEFKRASERGGGIKLLHFDSWEMGAQNWTPFLREEFTRRRGYDPLPYYPVYAGLLVESREVSERFLWDLRITCQELVIDNHVGFLKRYADKYGMKLSIEPYDLNPTCDIELGAAGDIPMCEFWSLQPGLSNFNSAFSVIEGSSAAHIIGQPVCPSESFTCAFDGYRQHPASVKNQGDWAFAGGVNRFMYHTFEHQALPDSLRPGMTMGIYGVHWDRGQTWWYLSDAYHKYVSRCQFLLQQGRTVADVLYLTPEGAPHVFLPPESALESLEGDVERYRNFRNTSMIPDRKGYSFDGCPPGIFMNSEVKDGNIVFPGGATYRLLALPYTETMTPALLNKIKYLLENGATVIGLPPHQSPSLEDYPACDDRVRALAKEIWGEGKLPNTIEKRSFGKGTLYFGSRLATEADNLYPNYAVTSEILSRTTPPDFTSTGEIRYTHRTTSDAEIYFVSNRLDTIHSAIATFRVSGLQPEIWDPVTGNRRFLPEYSEKDGLTAIPLKFNSHESYFIVFREKVNDVKSSQQAKNFPETEILLTLEDPWVVSFDPKWGGPDKILFESLTDWSQHTDEGIKYYSGTAFYTTTFNLSTASLQNSTCYLDLGKVKNIARVFLNGEETGTVWTSPWHVDITTALKDGKNELTVEVVNLWVNRLIGDERLPFDGPYRDHEAHQDKWPQWLLNGEPRTSGRYTFITHSDYSRRPDSPLQESGLLGPVTVRVQK
ncbi:MAG: glycosyl hydrolase [Dysgonamonadaceae bacterium]|jgi:hypothetical protein|nr:glycosyl hydrolase [Dysgonamonadaceae bacterium]